MLFTKNIKLNSVIIIDNNIYACSYIVNSYIIGFLIVWITSCRYTVLGLNILNALSIKLSVYIQAWYNF